MLVKNKPEDFNSSHKHLRDYLREKLKFNGHVKRERESTTKATLLDKAKSDKSD